MTEHELDIIIQEINELLQIDNQIVIDSKANINITKISNLIYDEYIKKHHSDEKISLQTLQLIFLFNINKIKKRIFAINKCDLDLATKVYDIKMKILIGIFEQMEKEYNNLFKSLEGNVICS